MSWDNTPEMIMIRTFNARFGLMVPPPMSGPVHVTRRKLEERLKFMQEELNEFAEAVATQDMAKLADALIELVYVAKGTAVIMNLPWEELMAEVHRANMDKVMIGPKDGTGHKSGIGKPEGWEPPNIDLVLENNGYVRAIWTDASGNINENACYDDLNI